MTLAPHRPMTSPSDQSELDAPPIPAGLVAILLLTAIALAVIFAIATVFYFTVKTNFLASGRPAMHWKHAIVLEGGSLQIESLKTGRCLSVAGS